eukprot:6192368-Pleurochrysis_carterae.AAC.2
MSHSLLMHFGGFRHAVLYVFVHSLSPTSARTHALAIQATERARAAPPPRHRSRPARRVGLP